MVAKVDLATFTVALNRVFNWHTCVYVELDAMSEDPVEEAAMEMESKRSYWL